MKVHISDHFTYKNIFRFTIFPIIMMVFTSLYSIVDGIFISNFASRSAFAAVNLVFPLVFIIGSIGFMMGTGGTALVSKLLGEGKKEAANKAFSLIIYATIVIGAIVSIGGFFAVTPIVKALASISPDSSEEMVNEAIVYGKILISFQVAFMLQNMFQSFFMVAEKSRLGFRVTITAGITNMVLDALFIGVFKWGVIGAAFATASGYVIGGIFPLLYFIFNKKNNISIGKANFDIKVVLRAAYNGMSEFVAQISMSVVSIVYNAQLLRAYGENGIAAYGIIMYVSFVFMAIFIGYSLGMAPAVGYNYGAQNKSELKNILHKSLIIISITAVLMALFSLLTARKFSTIFAKGNEELIALSTYGMMVYSLTFIACGYSIYISSFFTALNNGSVSAAISLLRTLVFQILFAYTFPLMFGNSGLWWAIASGEIVCAFIAFFFILTKRKKYGY